MTTTEMTTFSKLLPPKNNQRKRFDETALEQLAASIGSVGVVQSITVKKERGKFRIIAGHRRFLAIELLIKEGKADDAFPVPVSIRTETGADLEEIALAENHEREDLDSIDTCEAFTRLSDGGMSMAKIADKFGVTETYVRRHLALGRLVDQAKEMIRAGDMCQREAKHLASVTAEEQAAYFKYLEDNNAGNSEYAARRYFFEKPTADTAIFDIEEYTGGFVQDLFSDNAEKQFSDVDQFMELQHKAFDERKAAYESEGMTIIEPGHDWYMIEHKYRTADEAEEPTTVMMNFQSGRVTIKAGLVKVSRGSDSGTVSGPKPRYTAAQLQHAAELRTIAVQQNLISNRRKVLEVAVLQCMTGFQNQVSLAPSPRLQDRYGSGMLNSIEEIAAAFLTKFRDAGLSALRSSYYPEEGEITEPIPALFKLSGDRATVFKVIRSLTDEELDGLHSLLVTVTFHQSGDGIKTEEDEHNLVAIDVKADVRDSYLPDETFLKRYKSDRLKEIAVESGVALSEKSVAKSKKGDLVALLTGWFRAVPSDTPAERADMAKNWMDPIMAFPAIDPDAGDETSDEDEVQFLEAAE
ncbi:MAG: ParB/RepB/Spo0J family partition protein [Nisaea sp.]|uniref:ParB/RepB/Spo0J family partition protein n=3 Tax=Alphaproteobacteria TaxID=28211 RepID=UPI003263D038